MITGISLRRYFSMQHARSAAYFARAAHDLERRYDGDIQSTLLTEITANVTACLFSSVAFLEALANELLADASLADGGHLSGIDRHKRVAISEKAKAANIERQPILDKYDFLLLAVGAEKIVRGAKLGQDADALILLRNEIVHCKGEWFDVGTEGKARPGNFFDSKLRKRLHKQFPPRAKSEAHYDRWLGYGCAAWAITSALRYSDRFFCNLGIPPIYEHLRTELLID